MDYLLHLVRVTFEQHTELLLSVTVFLEQVGLPMPAYPSLIVAGSLPATMAGAASLCGMLGMAVLACLLADLVWYWMGRRFGSILTRRICHLSMSPEVCVMRSASFYQKHGLNALLVAKFLPGAGIMTTLLAGMNRTSLRKFLVYDAMGSMIWAGSALVLGYIFQDTVSQALALLPPFAYLGVIAMILIVLTYLAARWQSRHRTTPLIKLAPLSTISILQQASADEEP
ncbi:DedA family protein [Pusillimonas sp. MFBS29]|uniref:DedA family protein n=1 Tax=Pusillimonas sp. MFBS29 TaxID=2886690 RepID=UPI001D0F5E9F|nr:DedA family protein [Pusillimonas sp. MFBS29]MCC2597774.1 DedA family protein [Pusillimonas sp. MFBS29]